MAVAVGTAVLAGLLGTSAQAQVSVEVPFKIGLHIPSYDRVNGLSLPVGPEITVGDERLVLNPALTYRSHLGKIDPKLAVRLRIDSTFTLRLYGERGTFTNDAWIRSDFRNSVLAFVSGNDPRNYFRADRAEARLMANFSEDEEHPWLFVGVRVENAWSTGWRAGEGVKGPFSLRHYGYSYGMARPNPLIDRGHIASGLAGASGTWWYSLGSVAADLLVESAWHSPFSSFTQATLHTTGTLNTWRGQRFELDGHVVTTGGPTTPSQRLVYLGGSGSMPTERVFTHAGDRLFWYDLRYMVPVPAPEIMFISPVAIGPRVISGAAGMRQFGKPLYNIGARLDVGFLQFNYLIEPKSKRRAFEIGLNL